MRIKPPPPRPIEFVGPEKVPLDEPADTTLRALCT